MSIEPLSEDSLLIRMGDVMERVKASREYATALDRWRACAADAGYPYDSPDAIREDLWLRLDAIDRALKRPDEFLIAEGASLDSDARVSLETVHPDDAVLAGSPYPADEWDEVIRYEIAASLALMECDVELEAS